MPIERITRFVTRRFCMSSQTALYCSHLSHSLLTSSSVWNKTQCVNLILEMLYALLVRDTAHPCRDIHKHLLARLINCVYLDSMIGRFACFHGFCRTGEFGLHWRRGPGGQRPVGRNNQSSMLGALSSLPALSRLVSAQGMLLCLLTTGDAH